MVTSWLEIQQQLRQRQHKCVLPFLVKGTPTVAISRKAEVKGQGNFGHNREYFHHSELFTCAGIGSYQRLNQ